MVMVVSGRPLMVLKRQTADGDGDGGDGDGGDGDGGDGDGDGDDDDVDVISTFSSIWHGISWLCGEQFFPNPTRASELLGRGSLRSPQQT